MIMTFSFTIVKYISEELLGRPVLLVGQWALGGFREGTDGKAGRWKMTLEQGVSLRKRSKSVQAVWGSRAGRFNCDVSTTLESQAASGANRSVHLRIQRRGHTAQRRAPEQPAHCIRRRQQVRHIDAGPHALEHVDHVLGGDIVGRARRVGAPARPPPAAESITWTPSSMPA